MSFLSQIRYINDSLAFQCLNPVFNACQVSWVVVEPSIPFNYDQGNFVILHEDALSAFV